jgi:hypothetical protein
LAGAAMVGAAGMAKASETLIPSRMIRRASMDVSPGI